MAEEIIIQVFDEDGNTVVVSDDITNVAIEESAPINISSASPVQNVTVTEENVSIKITSVLATTGGGNADVEHIETDLLLKPGSNSRYKTFTYTADKISSQKVYEDNTLATQLYDLAYNYSGENLSNIVVIRLSDSFTYTKTFSYNGNGDLISINYQ